MLKHNPDNERIKHTYFTFLKNANSLSEATIDGVAKALARFEEYTKYKDFKTFKHEQATGFKKHFIEQKNKRKDTNLSKSTIHSTFAHLKRFFQWIAREQGYKSRIQFSDAEYFNTSNKDIQVATARRLQKVPTLEQIKHVISHMSSNTEIEQRNRALIAFTLLTGARDGAIASVKLKHVNLDEDFFFQDARDVKTKFSKTFSTFFFPVGDEIRQIVVDWIGYLKTKKLWGNEDPLFPMTNISAGASKLYEATGSRSAAASASLCSRSRVSSHGVMDTKASRARACCERIFAPTQTTTRTAFSSWKRPMLCAPNFTHASDGTGVPGKLTVHALPERSAKGGTMAAIASLKVTAVVSDASAARISGSAASHSRGVDIGQLRSRGSERVNVHL